MASLAAITISARVEQKSPWRPINATSHWLWDEEEAADFEGADMPHTVVGGATNLLAAGFWGSLFGAYLHTRKRASAAKVVRDAGLFGAAAGLLDYGILPRRLRPGWELALSGRSVVISMAAMALGLACGGLAAKSSREAAGRRNFELP